jgi:hypothetical protein
MLAASQLGCCHSRHAICVEPVEPLEGVHHFPGDSWVPCIRPLPCCRRVQDLFHSVQLNVNNPHFLIMQGRITKVLN